MLATSQPSLSSSRLPSVSNTSTTSMHSISKPKASVPPLISHGNRLMYSKVKVDHEPRKFYLYFQSKLGFFKESKLCMHQKKCSSFLLKENDNAGNSKLVQCTH